MISHGQQPCEPQKWLMVADRASQDASESLISVQVILGQRVELGRILVDSGRIQQQRVVIQQFIQYCIGVQVHLSDYPYPLLGSVCLLLSPLRCYWVLLSKLLLSILVSFQQLPCEFLVCILVCLWQLLLAIRAFICLYRRYELDVVKKGDLLPTSIHFWYCLHFHYLVALVVPCELPWQLTVATCIYPYQLPCATRGTNILNSLQIVVDS